MPPGPSTGNPPGTLAARVEELGRRRTEANQLFFEARADDLARCCHRMAERFARGGRLVAFGRLPAARSDVRHVAVEFVHPVIVGKRALPAIGLAAEEAHWARRLASSPSRTTSPSRSASARTRRARRPRRSRPRASADALTMAFASGGGAEWEFDPAAEDPFVAQELAETLYHVLWELVHVFFDRGLLEGREAGPVHDTGASSFLYPFLSESEVDLDGVIEDVRGSALMKASEVAALREQTLATTGRP